MVKKKYIHVLSTPGGNRYFSSLRKAKKARGEEISSAGAKCEKDHGDVSERDYSNILREYSITSEPIE